MFEYGWNILCCSMQSKFMIKVGVQGPHYSHNLKRKLSSFEGCRMPSAHSQNLKVGIKCTHILIFENSI